MFLTSLPHKVFLVFNLTKRERTLPNSEVHLLNFLHVCHCDPSLSLSVYLTRLKQCITVLLQYYISQSIIPISKKTRKILLFLQYA